jgi:hypothetical protein
MDTAKRAMTLLAEAERQLRELVGVAAAVGEYDAVQQITDWARRVGALVQDAQDAERTEAVPTGEAMRDDGCTAVGGRPARLGSSTARRSKRLPAKGEYPKFCRRGDQLVKIGWSKREKTEYEHKAPRQAVDVLTTAIARRADNGKLFTVEDLLPLKNPADGSEIPSYQAYVALAWFRRLGLVKQHGRRGYSVKGPSRVGEAVVASWEQLPAGSI